MSKDELLKLRTEALENLLGYFGTPAARHVMGPRWTSDHTLIVKLAKEALATTEEPALERFLIFDKAIAAQHDEPTVIGPADLLLSLQKAGLKKDSPPLDPLSWNLATENAAKIAENGRPGAYATEIARQIRHEKMGLPKKKGPKKP